MSTTRFLQLEGSICNLRTDSNNINLARCKLSGHNIDIDLSRYANTATAIRPASAHHKTARQWLKQLAADQAPVTLGLLVTDTGLQLHWLKSAEVHLLPPTQALLKQQAWRILKLGVPGDIVLWIVGLWLSFQLFVFIDGSLMIALHVALGTIGIIVTIAALVLAVFVLGGFDLLHQARDPGRATSWQAFFGQLPTVPNSIAAAPAAPAHPLPALRHAKVDQLELQRLSGRVTQINVRQQDAGVSIPGKGGNKLHLEVYRLELDQQPLTLIAGRNYGDADFFLAEGDEIDLVAAHTQPRDDRAGQLVMAFRRRDEDNAYACHKAMWPVVKRLRRPQVGSYRMTFYTGFHSKIIAKMLVFFIAPFLTLVMGLIVYGAPNLQAANDWWAPLVMGGGILLLALLMYLPNWLLDTKWLLGYPSRAQKVTTEVYALLGLGHPLRPNVTVKEI